MRARTSGQLHDRLELDELVSRYAWFVGQCAADEVADLFSEDGAFLGLDHDIRGRAALRAFYAHMLARRAVIPFVANKVFRFDGDVASGNSTLIALSGDSGMPAVCGYYDDDFVREDGQWRFRTRRFSSYLTTMRVQTAAAAIGPSAAPASTEESPNAETFRAAMRRLAASVHVVTTSEQGQRWGLTATAVASFSADPPTMIVCIHKQGHAYGPILRSRRIGINLLSDDQEAIAKRFSGSTGQHGEARFAGLHWREGAQAPLLADAAAGFDCTVYDAAEYFTHAVLICRVDRIELNEAKRPLIYIDQNYSRVHPQ